MPLLQVLLWSAHVTPPANWVLKPRYSIDCSMSRTLPGCSKECLKSAPYSVTSAGAVVDWLEHGTPPENWVLVLDSGKLA